MIPTLSNQSVPRTLKIVAYLFILCGVFSVVDTVAGLFNGRIVFNLGVLYVLVGLGLLRLSPRGWAWAMAFTWLGLIMTPIAGVASLYTPSRLQHIDLFVLYARQAPHGLILAVVAAMFATLCWQYSVLAGRQVRQLFG
jgi:hypothetical protein